MSAPSVRDDLLASAERLFAERGIDGVSLREINADAGARNASAIQYHFGDRVGLIRAVLDRHRPAIETDRHALLDAYDAVGRDDLRALAAALVLPLAAELRRPGGPGYLQVMSDLLNRPKPAIDTASLEDPSDSMNRWRTTVATILSPEAVRLHRRFLALRFTLSELARRSRDRRGRGDQLFVSDLIDSVVGLLGAPVSEETAELSRSRTGRQTKSP